MTSGFIDAILQSDAVAFIVAIIIAAIVVGKWW